MLDFPDRKSRKRVFLFERRFSIYFAEALLLGSVILLAVVIRVCVPNNNGWTTRSYTADFSVITRDKEERVSPFERGESKDDTCEKRFSFECKLVERQSKQNDEKLSRCY